MEMHKWKPHQYHGPLSTIAIAHVTQKAKYSYDHNGKESKEDEHDVVNVSAHLARSRMLQNCIHTMCSAHV